MWTDGELRAVLDLGALIGVHDIAGTGLAHRPHIAIVDQLRGSLVCLTDATALGAGQALGSPPPTEGHDPGAELDRFIKLRDRRCRFPAAAPGPAPATSTTAAPGRTGPPRTPTCAACASTTTGSSTRHRAGGSRRPTTAAWPSPCPTARYGSATHPGSAPTSTSRPSSALARDPTGTGDVTISR
ncbi:MAG: hypothetical protein M3Q47_13325 [Actinomycetota bacterium]|nr:hypothetical protein [Actinomycetota bacterium]